MKKHLLSEKDLEVMATMLSEEDYQIVCSVVDKLNKGKQLKENEWMIIHKTLAIIRKDTGLTHNQIVEMIKHNNRMKPARWMGFFMLGFIPLSLIGLVLTFLIPALTPWFQYFVGLFNCIVTIFMIYTKEVVIQRRMPWQASLVWWMAFLFNMGMMANNFIHWFNIEIF